MPARFFWSSSASTSGRSGSARQPAHGLVLVPAPARAGPARGGRRTRSSSAVRSSSSTGMRRAYAVGPSVRRTSRTSSSRSRGRHLARADDLPGAVHLEVGVQRQPAREAGEHVLAVGVERRDDLPRQVGRRVLRDAEVGRARRCGPPAARAAAGRPSRRCLPPARLHPPPAARPRTRRETMRADDEPGARRAARHRHRRPRPGCRAATGCARRSASACRCSSAWRSTARSTAWPRPAAPSRPASRCSRTATAPACRAVLLATVGVAVSTFVGAAVGDVLWLFALTTAVWGFAAGMLVSLGVAAGHHRRAVRRRAAHHHAVLHAARGRPRPRRAGAARRARAGGPAAHRLAAAALAGRALGARRRSTARSAAYAAALPVRRRRAARPAAARRGPAGAARPAAVPARRARAAVPAAARRGRADAHDAGRPGARARPARRLADAGRGRSRCSTTLAGRGRGAPARHRRGRRAAPLGGPGGGAHGRRARAGPRAAGSGSAGPPPALRDEAAAAGPSDTHVGASLVGRGRAARDRRCSAGSRRSSGCRGPRPARPAPRAARPRCGTPCRPCAPTSPCARRCCATPCAWRARSASAPRWPGCCRSSTATGCRSRRSSCSSPTSARPSPAGSAASSAPPSGRCSPALVTALLQPGPLLLALLVVVAAWGCYAVLFANYALFGLCVTAFVVFLLVVRRAAGLVDRRRPARGDRPRRGAGARRVRRVADLGAGAACRSSSPACSRRSRATAPRCSSSTPTCRGSTSAGSRSCAPRRGSARSAAEASVARLRVRAARAAGAG